MDDLKPEGWLALVVAVGGSIWTAVHLFFNLKSDVKALEKRSDAHDLEFQALRKASEARFDEVREDILRVSDKTERRHDVIEAKIDRLIERSLPRT